jgi:enoyl-CoA hydratase/carnithine racemase
MDKSGKVTTSLINGIATINFMHPKSNSLPAKMLKEITEAINKFAEDTHVLL